MFLISSTAVYNAGGNGFLEINKKVLHLCVCVFAGQECVCGGECVTPPAVWEWWRPGGRVFLGRDGGPRGRRGRRPLRSSVGVRRWSHTFPHRGDTRAAHTNGPEEWVRNKYSRKHKVCWLTKENIFFIPVYKTYGPTVHTRLYWCKSISYVDVRVLSEAFCGLDEWDAAVQKLKVIIVLPQCSSTALNDPVPTIHSEHGGQPNTNQGYVTIWISVALGSAFHFILYHTVLRFRHKNPLLQVRKRFSLT